MDYLKFCQMMVNGGELNGKRYLSRKTVERVYEPHGRHAGQPVPDHRPRLHDGPGLRRARLDEGMGWTPGSKGDAMWAGAWGTSL